MYAILLSLLSIGNVDLNKRFKLSICIKYVRCTIKFLTHQSFFLVHVTVFFYPAWVYLKLEICVLSGHAKLASWVKPGQSNAEYRKIASIMIA